MNEISFTFSDLISGYVTQFDRGTDTYTVKTSGGQEFQIKLKSNTYAQVVRNLGDPYQDSTGSMRDMLVPGRFLYTYGVFYPEASGPVFEAQFILFLGRKADEYVIERPDWWVKQIGEIGDFYLQAQFGDAPVDYRGYRTLIKLGGEKEKDNYRQETDTISRLVYGFASAYMFTGDERFLEAAEKGTEYLRAHMRFYDADEKIVYWYHGIDVRGNKEDKVFSSEFGDDYDAIPAYEQIYALAGPIQTYRITGDPRILKDAELTVSLFERFFLDTEKGGYFSHLDPITLDPRSDALGANKGKKNWNSVGDHAPAYLINLYLATGEERYAKMLEHTFDMIAEHMPNYENSPFMQEKFHEDWSHDITHMWQQNRGVPGHNLKVAWNITRMYNLTPKAKYKWFAERIAAEMPKVTMDVQRAGWYDVMERLTGPGEELHRFAFHDRKAWWQQEQGILAYLIMNGVFGGEEYLKLARESEAFYNAFFLDHDDGAVFFNVLANGLPFLVGTERFKGSHSMSGYHSTELCYLAQTYQNLLIHKQPLTLHFKPRPNGFVDNVLRVSPDILPAGSIKITAVEIEGKPHADFDAVGLTVKLPVSEGSLRVKVTLEPV